MSQLNDLQVLLERANALASKEHLTKQEERAYNLLLAEISLVKNGKSLRSIDKERLNDVGKRNGFAPVKLKTKKSERRAKDFRDFVYGAKEGVLYGRAEQRDGGIGEPKNAIGTYAGLGYFLPVEFVKDVTKAALKLGDEILDPAVSNVITSTNGRMLQIPVLNDTAEAFVPVGEGALDTSNDDDPQHTGNVSLGAISFRSTWKTSIESFQDVEASGDLLNVWSDWTAQRIARGVGKLVINGQSTDKIVGLIQQLENVGTVPIIAQGSAVNDGTGATGVNSVGSQDLAAAYFGVDPMYRHSPRCVWFMNDLTLLQLARLVDKSGRPIVLWEEDGLATIFGKRVAVCNSMPSSSASQVTVVFGDASYCYIRRINDGLSGVRVLRERYIDAGQIGLQTISRWDFKLAVGPYVLGKSPFSLIQQHS